MIFNELVEYLRMTEEQSLDGVFLALGHPIRRQILRRLAQGQATVTEIASPFDTSLNAISKHLKVLEKAGLVHREVVGREHYLSISPQPLQDIVDWLAYYESFWKDRLDAMEQVLRDDAVGKGSG